MALANTLCTVEPAERLLKLRRLNQARVTWKEDVRQWHPGQEWIWQPGGFGVLDPGINALSILTKIIPEPIFAKSACLYVPSNCATPIAADLEFETDSGAPIFAAFDFRHTGVQTWDIDLSTGAGPITSIGGRRPVDDGLNEPVPGAPGVLGSEYAAIYPPLRRVDRAQAPGSRRALPLQLVADVFLVAQQVAVEPFLP